MTQEKALSILKTGACVFLTGEPGSGKTHTVNRYVSYLREHGIEPAITASTGIAATHIGGFTIHSWSGIGIKKVLTEQDLEELSQREKVVSRVSRTNVLIIDEISMLDARTLGAVDSALRSLRQKNEPFGGVQVVFVGDFFQLPPIARFGEDKAEFAFHSPVWREVNPIVCYLSEQHRQEDSAFLSFLSSVRSGRVTDATRNALSTRLAQPEGKDVYTRLHSHNVDVDKVNNEKLTELKSEARVFDMESRGSNSLVLQLKKGCLSPERLLLKVGARVMFTKNSVEGKFVNGTLGEIDGFSQSGMPIVRARNGRRIEAEPSEWTITDGARTLAKIIQIPLRLAWAITIHKSQGMTLDSAVIDLREAFEYGQGYVALSRVRAFSGIFLLGFNVRALEVHGDVLKADGDFKARSIVAGEEFGEISSDERIKMEANFIKASGGKLEKSSVKKKTARGRSSTGLSTYEETLALVNEGKSIEESALARGITRGTIISHLEELYMSGKLQKEKISKLITPELHEKMSKIHSAFRELGIEKLTPIFEKLGGEYPYDDLRLARLCMHVFSESSKNN